MNYNLILIYYSDSLLLVYMSPDVSTLLAHADLEVFETLKEEEQISKMVPSPCRLCATTL